MGISAKILPALLVSFALVGLPGCKHPLAIVGKGDIVDVNDTGRGCTLEQFRVQDTACTENEVSGDYFVNYRAKPKPGWRFVRWDGPCPPDSDFQYCRFGITGAVVSWWDENFPDARIPPTTAVFELIVGVTGYLVAGTAVAGVTYETATKQGVTGIDGSFQYEPGEKVRFKLGNTLLGEVTGQATVTPFDLAGSTAFHGQEANRALAGRIDLFNAVVNLAVLLQRLDSDGNPENGISIKPGTAALLLAPGLDVSSGEILRLIGGATIDVQHAWRAF